MKNKNTDKEKTMLNGSIRYRGKETKSKTNITGESVEGKGREGNRSLIEVSIELLFL